MSAADATGLVTAALVGGGLYAAAELLACARERPRGAVVLGRPGRRHAATVAASGGLGVALSLLAALLRGLGAAGGPLGLATAALAALVALLLPAVLLLRRARAGVSRPPG
jgi:hypothetical protein